MVLARMYTHKTKTCECILYFFRCNTVQYFFQVYSNLYTNKKAANIITYVWLLMRSAVNTQHKCGIPLAFNTRPDSMNISCDNHQHLKCCSAYGNWVADSSTFCISSIKHCWLFTITGGIKLGIECDIFTPISSTVAVSTSSAVGPTYKSAKPLNCATFLNKSTLKKHHFNK